jgi:hypothetical protein
MTSSPPWLTELQCWLRDPVLVVALRQEYAPDIVAAVDRLGVSGIARPWLLAHAAELAGDPAGALRYCDEAAHWILDDGARPAPARWLELQAHVLRARLADPAFDRAAADACVRRLLADTAASRDPLLFGHAATALATIALDGPPQAGRAASSALLDALALLEDGCAAAARAIAASDGWNRVETAEQFATLQLTALRTLFRAAERGIAPSSAARAWHWFRKIRRDIDLETGDATPVLPAGTAVVEFLALPGDPLRVCVTDRLGQVHGDCDRTVADAAGLQYATGEQLRDWAQAGAGVEDRVVELCRWTWDAAAAWSSLLLESAIWWSDGVRSTLDARLRAAHPNRVCIIPHGPVSIVPWGLLRAGGQPAWLESWAITLCSTWRASRADAAPTDRAKRLLLWRAPVRTGMFSTTHDPCELFEAMETCERAWLAGHGTFRPPTHGHSTLNTLGRGVQVELQLPPLLDTALRFQRDGRAMPGSLWMSICDAGEVSRRSFLTELVTLAHAFRVAGIPCVVAPKWPSTSLAEDAVEDMVRRSRCLGTLAREMWIAAYQPWRDCRNGDDVARLARDSVRNLRWPLCDLGAFDVHGHVDQDAMERRAR